MAGGKGGTKGSSIGKGRVAKGVHQSNGSSTSTSSAARRQPKSPTAPRDKSNWSAGVTEKSDALDLREGVFKLDDPDKIAASLKRSAESSHRRKSSPFRSALSMLTFYINRGGKNLPSRRRRILERAKDRLRGLFGRKDGSRSAGASATHKPGST